jgi:hypothetical protein
LQCCGFFFSFFVLAKLYITDSKLSAWPFEKKKDWQTLGGSSCTAPCNVAVSAFFVCRSYIYITGCLSVGLLKSSGRQQFDRDVISWRLETT